MVTESADYELAFRVALEAFWTDRAGQMARQRARGLTDAGTRGSVTGGTHLNGVRDVLHQVIRDAGLEPAPTSRLPGYYRAAKNWDTVVMKDDSVVAIIELKSQVGSFGNNINNRIEEMIGQSLDIWRATRERLLGPTRPWFGYVMILQEDAKSIRPQRAKSTILPVDPAFHLANYVEQYRLAFERLRLEGDFNAACLATTSATLGTPIAAYPDESMTFGKFARSLQARASEFTD